MDPSEAFTMTQELQITDLALGEGKEAVKGALISAHYTGWLEDGTKFDSSHDRGRPFQCVIGTGRVIQGWDIGLMGMRVGGKRKLFVPAPLAYGERQVGALIKPHSNLVFEIELLEVLTRERGEDDPRGRTVLNTHGVAFERVDRQPQR